MTNKTMIMHNVLREMPYGIYIVGVGKENHHENVLIVSWITQCSFDPPMIVIAIRTDSESSRLLSEHGVFSVNLIGPDQEALARTIVKPYHRTGDKLANLSHTRDATGVPILREAIAYIECEVRHIIECGDHLLAVGEAVNAGGQAPDKILTCADLGWRYGG